MWAQTDREAWQRSIAVGATSLDESLRVFSDSAPGGESADPTPEALRALAAWTKAVAAGDTAAFRRRLAWDGLDEARVAAGLSRGWLAGDELPRWAHWLGRFENASAERALERAEGPVTEGPETTRILQALPFPEFALAIRDAARTQFVDQHGASPADDTTVVFDALEAQLVREVSMASELALCESYEAFRAGRLGRREHAMSPIETGSVFLEFTRSLLRGGIRQFLSYYPALARQLALLSETWVDSSWEFMKRLADDRMRIASALGVPQIGSVVRVRTGLSDRHRGGRRALDLEFASGIRLIYKPRSVRMDAAFGGFCRWLRNEGLDVAPRAAEVVSGDGYGWTEFVEHEDVGSGLEAQQYFRHAGSLMCLAHILRGRDLHMENNIATRSGPVLIDAEMLFQPTLAVPESPGFPGSDESEAASCLESGLLSLIDADSRGVPFDMGGLRGTGGAVSPEPEREWRSIGTDEVHWVETPGALPDTGNVPRLLGRSLRPEHYPAEFLDGFERTYRYLLERRDVILGQNGPLAAFSEADTRVLLRGSRQYAVVLQTLSMPRYQRSGLYRSLVIEALNRIHVRCADRPQLWPLVAAERVSLEKLDIPLFTISASETTLVGPNQQAVTGYFSTSGESAVRERFRAMSADDLERQLEDLRLATHCPVNSRFVTPLEGDVVPSSDSASGARLEEFSVEAAWIGTELLSHAIRGDDGALHWKPTGADAKTVQARVLGDDLHGGAAGIAVFFAGLFKATGQSLWQEASRSAFQPVASSIGGHDHGRAPGGRLGATDGAGSAILSAIWLAELLADDEFIALALRAADTIDETAIRADRRLDVMNGTAGTLIALMALHDVTGDRRALELASICGRHLIDRRVITRGGAFAWPGTDRRALAGLAHGAGGIALALARLARVTGDRTVVEAVGAAYRYERILYSSAGANWPVLGQTPRDAETLITAWCHGAAGIGLSRALVLSETSDGDVRSEMNTALLVTAKHPFGRSDHLCCGNLGRADVLLTAGLRLNRPDLVESARRLVESVVERARERGRFALPFSPHRFVVFDPGFFRGLSGIGYQLLRVSSPQGFPSVLGFETASRTRSEAAESRGELS